MISGTIAFDSSYPTGGEALTALAAKFKTLLRVVCEQNTGYMFEFDKTNTKLKVYAPVNVVAGSGTAATNNYIFKNTGPVIEVDGTGTAFQLPGAEVLNTTDLSGLTAVSFYAVGLM
jgi:hypothetical protein